MSKHLKSVVVVTMLFASASFAAAQDRSRNPDGQSARDSYASAPLPSGPYAPPPKKAEPRQPVKPFTWEEKRFFDMSNGEEG